MDDLLTAQDATEELGYHIKHLYYLLKKGTIKGQQFNRVWMIPRSEVERIKALQGKGGRLPKAGSASHKLRTDTCGFSHHRNGLVTVP